MTSTLDIRSASDALISAKNDLDRELTRMTESQKRRTESELSDAVMVIHKSVLVLKEIKNQVQENP